MLAIFAVIQGFHRTTTIKQHQNKKIEIFWSHYEEKGRLLGERNNAKHNIAKSGTWKTTRTTWIENIRSWTGLNMYQLMRATENRVIWKQTVQVAAKLRIEDG